MNLADTDLVDRLIQRLSDPANADSPAVFPRDAHEAERPGLYAWWADNEGVDVLSEPLGESLPALIYAGQAGATSTLSKKERAATLRSRIGGNHLNGNIGSSTFRRTLTAVLLEPLHLQLLGPDRLDPASNREVSAWMRKHLRVAIAGVDDRATLAEVEGAVLHRLDPPLNLMGMPPTAVRARLRLLRATLSAPPVPTTPSDPQRSTDVQAKIVDNARMTLHDAMVEVLRD